MIKLTNKLLLLFAIVGFLGLLSCEEWGTMDPEAGNQIFPKLELMGDYRFDEGFPEDVILDNYESGTLPSIFTDDFKGKVVSFNGGYARFNNPLTQTTLQTGASLTFWVKVSENNLDAALFSFTDEDEEEMLFFSPNAWLSYKGPGGSYEVNNPSTNATDLLSPDEWHFLAICIQNEGYFVYVDDEIVFDETVEDFDFSSIVNSLMNLPYFYLGYGSSASLKNVWIDDVKIYRNVISSKETAVPTVSGGGEPYVFPPRGTVGYYKLDGSFVNSLDDSQDGELITVVTQATPSVFEEDPVRGTVWHQQEGWNDHANGWAYTRFDNPLKGKTLEGGVSISMWLNPPFLNYWDQIFVLNDGVSKFWFNAIAYLGYNGEGGWFDCHHNNADNALVPGEWTFVTINMLENGFEVYYDGELKFDREDNAAYAGDLQDFGNVLNMFTSTDDFLFGGESWWRAAPTLIDDLFLGSRPLTEQEIKSLYLDTKKDKGGVVINPNYLPELVGYYKLDNDFTNALNTDQSGELITVVPQATPSDFIEDPVRGTVWFQQEGWNDHANGWAYTRFDNPLKGKTVEEGVSVSLWLNPPVLNWWDQIFVLNDGVSKFWFNAIGYLGYNGEGGWFDCHNSNTDNALTVDEWTLVTINLTYTGFEVYYNGELKFDKENNAAYAGDLEDFGNVVSMLTSSDDFMLGGESWWRAAPALIDEIYLCASPLTEEQAAALYNATKK